MRDRVDRAHLQQFVEPGRPAQGSATLEQRDQAGRAEQCRLALIARRHGMYPSDPFAAARLEAMVAHVEDLCHKVGPTIGLPEPENEAGCEALVADKLPAWAAAAQRNIEAGCAWRTKAKPVPLAIERRIRNVARVLRRPECGSQDRCRDTRSTLRKNPHDEYKA